MFVFLDTSALILRVTAYYFRNVGDNMCEKQQDKSVKNIFVDVRRVVISEQRDLFIVNSET